MKAKFELEAWSDAETKLLGAIALCGCMEESLYQSGSKSDSQAIMGIRTLLEGALMNMECGRIHGN